MEKKKTADGIEKAKNRILENEKNLKLDDEERNVALTLAVSALQNNVIYTESNIFDIEELHENCTVHILKNSLTGEISVGWWEND